jgi:hypothetical protein
VLKYEDKLRYYANISRNVYMAFKRFADIPLLRFVNMSRYVDMIGNEDMP